MQVLGHVVAKTVDALLIQMGKTSSARTEVWVGVCRNPWAKVKDERATLRDTEQATALQAHSVNRRRIVQRCMETESPGWRTDIP